MSKVLLLICLMTPFFSDASNRSKFLIKGFSWVKKAECGDCKQICHADKKDTGGFTCIGISIKHNLNFYIQYLKLTYSHFNKMYSYSRFIPIPRNMYNAHSDKLPPYIFAAYYWKHYAKVYNDCPFNVLMHLTDMSILSGKRSAIKTLQRVSRIKADGIWGKNSIKACKSKDFKFSSYVKERKRYLSKLKQCKRYCKGWNKRIDQLHSKFN